MRCCSAAWFGATTPRAANRSRRVFLPLPRSFLSGQALCGPCWDGHSFTQYAAAGLTTLGVWLSAKHNVGRKVGQNRGKFLCLEARGPSTWGSEFGHPVSLCVCCGVCVGVFESLPPPPLFHARHHSRYMAGPKNRHVARSFRLLPAAAELMRHRMQTSQLRPLGWMLCHKDANESVTTWLGSAGGHLAGLLCHKDANQSVTATANQSGKATWLGC